jgi:hypothetical protein
VEEAGTTVGTARVCVLAILLAGPFTERGDDGSKTLGGGNVSAAREGMGCASSGFIPGGAGGTTTCCGAPTSGAVPSEGTSEGSFARGAPEDSAGGNPTTRSAALPMSELVVVVSADDSGTGSTVGLEASRASDSDADACRLTIGPGGPAGLGLSSLDPVYTVGVGSVPALPTDGGDGFSVTEPDPGSVCLAGGAPCGGAPCGSISAGDGVFAAAGVVSTAGSVYDAAGAASSGEDICIVEAVGGVCGGSFSTVDAATGGSSSFGAGGTVPVTTLDCGTTLGCSLAWASPAARTKAPKDKTSAATKAGIFRLLRGPN